MSTAWIHSWNCLTCGLTAAALQPTEYWRPGICPDCKTLFGAVLIFEPQEVNTDRFDLSEGWPVLTKEVG